MHLLSSSFVHGRRIPEEYAFCAPDAAQHVRQRDAGGEPRPGQAPPAGHPVRVAGGPADRQHQARDQDGGGEDLGGDPGGSISGGHAS